MKSFTVRFQLLDYWLEDNYKTNKMIVYMLVKINNQLELWKKKLGGIK